MSNEPSQRSECDMLFKIINEKQSQKADPSKPVMMILPNNQGLNDHSRVMEGLVFNTEKFDPDQVTEQLGKLTERSPNQSEVKGLIQYIHFPDGSNNYIGFTSFSENDVGGRTMEKYVQDMQTWAADTPDVQSAEECQKIWKAQAQALRAKQKVEFK